MLILQLLLKSRDLFRVFGVLEVSLQLLPLRLGLIDLVLELARLCLRGGRLVHGPLDGEAPSNETGEEEQSEAYEEDLQALLVLVVS